MKFSYIPLTLNCTQRIFSVKAWDENDSLLGLLKKTGSRYHSPHFILHCKVLALIGYFSSRILAALIAKSRKQALISMHSARAFYLVEQITSTGASMEILIYDHHQNTCQVKALMKGTTTSFVCCAAFLPAATLLLHACVYENVHSLRSVLLLFTGFLSHSDHRWSRMLTASSGCYLPTPLTFR